MPPTVVAVTPATGPLAGLNIISVFGTGFLGCLARVQFNRLPALNFGQSATIVNDSLMTCVAPNFTPYGPGPVDIGVTDTATLTVWSLPGGYTFAGATPGPPGGDCVRKAWLTLGSLMQPLEDEDGGYACTQLDLGYPAVREVVTNRPDQNGIDDRTTLMGARVVTADISALASAGAVIDAVATAFAPYMLPSARPVLHYVLDRPGATERTMTLRASGYSWPIKGAKRRDIQLSWVAADPVARDPTVHSATAWAGSSGAIGRTYNLTFNRVYPAGGMPPTVGQIRSPGDVPVRPMLRIYGPITDPSVQLSTPAPVVNYLIRFVAGFRIDPAHFVDVDTNAKTVYLDGDTTKPAMASLDWQRTSWPVLPAGNAINYLYLTGTSTSQVSQVVATWSDGYLS
jgi:IPT/TIG domain